MENKNVKWSVRHDLIDDMYYIVHHNHLYAEEIKVFESDTKEECEEWCKNNNHSYDIEIYK